ncbi:MAG: ABC transporter permease [Bacillota bacterium]
MRQLWAIIRKEFMQIRRDPRTLGIIILAPVIMLVIYGYAINFDIKHIGIIVCDLDRSAASRDFIRGFTASEYFDLTGFEMNPEKLTGYLDAGKCRAVLWIPRGYGRNIKAGIPGTVFLGVDGSDANTAVIAAAYLRAYAGSYAAKILSSRLLRAGQGMRGERMIPFQVEPRIWYNSALQSSHFIVPGLISTLLMMLVSLLTAMAVTGEKERNTFEQLASSPVKPWILILGKILPYSVCSFGGVLLIIPAGIMLFGVPLRGSPVVLFAFIIMFLLAILGFGLFVSTIAKTQQQAMFLAISLTAMPAILLSGFVFPIESMPWPLKLLSYLVPARYFLVSLRGVFLKGVGFEILWPEFLALTIFACILLTMAALRFKKRLD